MPTLDDVLSIVVAYIDEEFDWLFLSVLVFFLAGAFVQAFLSRMRDTS